MAYGFIYLMSNESFKELYKIGYTLKSPTQRANELSNTSVPSDFRVLFYAEAECPHNYEKALHETFANKRHNLCREYFKLNEDDLKYFVRLCREFADNTVYTHDFKRLAETFIKSVKDE